MEFASEIGFLFSQTLMLVNVKSYDLSLFLGCEKFLHWHDSSLV